MQMEKTELLMKGLDGLASQLAMAITLGREVGGEEYMQRLEEEFRKAGYRVGPLLAKAVGIKEGETNCATLGKLMDFLDDTMGCQWKIVESSDTAFEKRIFKCPISRTYSRMPEICSRFNRVLAEALLESISPKASIVFGDFLPSGGLFCGYRIEIKEK